MTPGIWNEEFIHSRYALKMAETYEEQRSKREEARKAHEVHSKTRADLLVKYYPNIDIIIY
jgi:hypothetical protein